MKHISYILLFSAFGLILTPFSDAEAQFRDGELPDQLADTGQRTAAVQTDSDFSEMFGLFDFAMDHSYEMQVGSIGGHGYNQNMYTNTMHFLFSEDLRGRLDLSMSHSPFGASPFGQDQGMNLFIRNAEVQYDFTDNSSISLQFSQQPAGHGYFGRGFGSPYGMSSFYDRRRGW